MLSTGKLDMSSDEVHNKTQYGGGQDTQVQSFATRNSRMLLNRSLFTSSGTRAGREKQGTCTRE